MSCWVWGCVSVAAVTGAIVLGKKSQMKEYCNGFFARDQSGRDATSAGKITELCPRLSE